MEAFKDVADRRYRLRGQYRQWIGKPDPSGFGKYCTYSDNLPWLREEAARRRRNGDKVLALEERKGRRWASL